MLPSRSTVVRRTALFLAYCLLLFASFSYDVFRINGNFRDAYIGYDSYLVLNRLKLAADGVNFWHPLKENGTQENALGRDYYSQFGLQGVVLSAIMLATHADPVPFAYQAANACSLLTAAVLALFFVSIARGLGPMTAHLGVFFTCLSPILLRFAPSVYWCSFLLFAPFVCVWTLYPWCGRSFKGRLGLAAAVLLLVMLKCLCGYEFVTTIALSPVAAVVFHLVRAGEFQLRRVLELVGWAAAGCAGFAVAMGLHVLQLVCLFGPSQPNVLLQTAQRRLYAGDPRLEAEMHFSSSLLSWIPDKIEYPLNCFLHYFTLCAIVWPGGDHGVRLSLVCGVALVLAVYATAQRRQLSPQARALFFCLVVSLLTSLSWQVVAVNHMCVHFHLNQIVYWVPFLLLAGVALGFLTERLMIRLHVCAYALRLMAPACLLLIAWSFLQHSHQQITEQLHASRIQRHVLGNWQRIEPWPGKGMTGYFDGIDVVRRSNGAWTEEMARSVLAADVAEDVLMISGWLFDPEMPDLPKNACLLREVGTLQMAECQFFTRGDVSAYVGKPAPHAAFHITVPKPQPGDRILLLCGKDLSRMVEVKRF